MRPRASMDAVKKRKFLILPGNRTSSLPTCSPSILQLSCPSKYIIEHKQKWIIFFTKILNVMHSPVTVALVLVSVVCEYTFMGASALMTK
jgi:hypothetical protein